MTREEHEELRGYCSEVLQAVLDNCQKPDCADCVVIKDILMLRDLAGTVTGQLLGRAAGEQMAEELARGERKPVPTPLGSRWPR